MRTLRIFALLAMTAVAWSATIDFTVGPDGRIHGMIPGTSIQVPGDGLNIKLPPGWKCGILQGVERLDCDDPIAVFRTHELRLQLSDSAHTYTFDLIPQPVPEWMPEPAKWITRGLSLIAFVTVLLSFLKGERLPSEMVDVLVGTIKRHCSSIAPAEAPGTEAPRTFQISLDEDPQVVELRQKARNLIDLAERWQRTAGQQNQPGVEKIAALKTWLKPGETLQFEPFEKKYQSAARTFLVNALIYSDKEFDPERRKGEVQDLIHSMTKLLGWELMEPIEGEEYDRTVHFSLGTQSGPGKPGSICKVASRGLRSGKDTVKEADVYLCRGADEPD